MSVKETYQQPNEFGYYGKFGGAYIPEMLHRNVEELKSRYLEITGFSHLIKYYFKPAICTDKSINLLEYPYSLSYHDTNLKKVEFKPIPAVASMIEVLLSEIKS